MLSFADLACHLQLKFKLLSPFVMSNVCPWKIGMWSLVPYKDDAFIKKNNWNFILSVFNMLLVKQAFVSGAMRKCTTGD
jgi:hypothetical protein